MKQMTWRRALCVLLCVLLCAIGMSGCKEDKETSLDPHATYYADIVIEGYGTITVELYQNSAPITVENFIKLAEDGFYDGLTFHRIIKGFMMQGGDPGGDGISDDDQETIVGEFAENGYSNPVTHERGVISMARTSDPDSASSQFFIMQEKALHLDGQYAAFGKVVVGMDVVDRVCNTAKPIDNNGTIAAANQPVIKSITIRKE